MGVAVGVKRFVIRPFPGLRKPVDKEDTLALGLQTEFIRRERKKEKYERNE